MYACHFFIPVITEYYKYNHSLDKDVVRYCQIKQ